MKLAMFPALLLIPLVALCRVLLAWHPGGTGGASDWLAGAAPLSAVALCAGVYLPRRLAVAVPLGILALSDALIDFHFGVAFFTWQMAVRYLALALIAFAGVAMRDRRGLLPTMAGSAAASLFFYVVTNAFCWLDSPDYPPNLGGLMQSLTVGLPGYLPSGYFFRNALVSDLLYSILFVVCLRAGAAEPAVAVREPARA